MARSAAALRRVGQLASSNYLSLPCIRRHFERPLSPCEDGYLQKMILLKRSLGHLCAINMSPSRNHSVVMKLVLNSNTSQCNILMPCYIHPSCNGSRSGGSPKQHTLSGYDALPRMLRMPIIENHHSHQTQTTSLDTINELERLNDCLRARFVNKVAQQVDGPDLAYYFFRWAGRQPLFHKNINTHDAIHEMLGAPGKLDMQVQQQLLQVLKIEHDSIVLMSLLFFIIPATKPFCLFTYTRAILQLNGTFRWELAPYDFMSVVFAYNINSIFPLVMVHARR